MPEPRNYKCQYCNKTYCMEWAYRNHMNLENERQRSIEKKQKKKVK